MFLLCGAVALLRSFIRGSRWQHQPVQAGVGMSPDAARRSARATFGYRILGS